MTSFDISVVIPSYNCADFLRRAVCSAYLLQGGTIEVIVVDDGSTDSTEDVCAQLTKEFCALQVIRQANAGLSAARNAGICAATGAYLLLLDADDALLPFDIRDAIAEAPDMVRFGVEETSEGSTGAVLHQESQPMVSGRTYLRSQFDAGNFFTNSWAYLYRLDWLQQTGVKFIKGLLHEDNLFTVQALLLARRFKAVPDLVYYYIRRQGSITLAQGDSRYLARIRSYVEIARHLTTMANADPAFDFRWKIQEVLFGAHVLAQSCSSRIGHWLVLQGTWRFMATYRGFGDHGFRWEQRRLLRKFAHAWLRGFRSN